MKASMFAVTILIVALCGCSSNDAALAKAKAEAEAARAELARVKAEAERAKSNQAAKPAPGDLQPNAGTKGQPPTKVVAPFPDPASDAKARRRQEFDQLVRREVTNILPDASWKIEAVKLMSDPSGFLEGIGSLGSYPKITITLRSGGLTAKSSSEEVKSLLSNNPGRQIVTANLFFQPAGSKDSQMLFIDECTTPQEKVSRLGKAFTGEETYLTFLRRLAQIVKKHEDRYLDFVK